MDLPVELHPFAALRLRVTDDAGSVVELRTGDLAGLVELSAVAAAGVHAEDVMPFTTPWTRCDPAERARRTLRFQLQGWAGWTPEDWRWDFVVRRDGVVVGTQSLEATGFAVRQEVSTGSWLGLEHQGRGTGRLMRTAVLALAFEHLGARSATSLAFLDNPASQAVSRTLGYRDDGEQVDEREGAAVGSQRFRMTHADWTGRPRPVVEVAGVAEARAALGL